MQALHSKQQEEAFWNSLFDKGYREPTVEEKVERCKRIQFIDHEPLFAVQYSTIHKAASDGDLMGLTYLLNMSDKGRRERGERHMKKPRVTDFDKNGCKIRFIK